jgi:hypothetical protein
MLLSILNQIKKMNKLLIIIKYISFSKKTAHFALKVDEMLV